MIWIDERRCIGELIVGRRRRCEFRNGQDIELRDEGDGDASICGHLGGMMIVRSVWCYRCCCL